MKRLNYQKLQACDCRERERREQDGSPRCLYTQDTITKMDSYTIEALVDPDLMNV